MKYDGSSINCSVGYAEGARAALSLGGTMLGFYPVKVLPSKTAIAPVNPTFLPRVREPNYYDHCIFCYLQYFGYVLIFHWFFGFQTEDEREMCARTIYCTNIDKKVTFFGSLSLNMVHGMAYKTLITYLFGLFCAGYSSWCQTLFRISLWRGSR